MSATMCNIRHTRKLGGDEEKKLFQSHRNGDQRATWTLIEAHMPMINRIAGRYSRFGPNHEDFVQEGVAGFMQGLEHFDPDKGFRINTFARWWIKANITDTARTNHSLVKISGTSNQRALFARLGGAMARCGIYSDHLTSSDLDKLEKDLGLPRKDIEEMVIRLKANAVTSLSSPLQGDDGKNSSVIDLLADEDSLPEDLEDRLDDDRRRAAMRNALGGLDARKRDIIERRYLSDHEETLAEVAEVYGITRERVRQIEVHAIEELGLALSGKLSQMAGQERKTVCQSTSA